MREHGVLKRILLVYEEAERRLRRPASRLRPLRPKPRQRLCSWTPAASPPAKDKRPEPKPEITTFGVVS